MPKLKHYDNLGTARFITFSCYEKHKYFNDEECIQILIKHIAALRANYKINIYGYVIMPDHVHLVLYPPDGLKLGVLVGQMKARTAHEIITPAREILNRPNGQPTIWQRRCYDHNCRKPEIVREKIIYCHNNPVVRGLVSAPDEWLWSSYNWYCGMRDVPLIIDEYEL